MRVLVLGSKGQLGSCLYDHLIKTYHEVIYASRSDIDITDFDTLRENISSFRPDVVINASAYTAVDKAEDEFLLADLINHLAVARIADTCKELNAYLIHISSDYVFDGKAKKPYREEDKTNPKGEYGKSKLKGEIQIQRSGCDHIILRTSWVFSEYGNNFLRTMLRLGKDLDELNIVGDQIGCPTYAQDLAISIVSILSSLTSKQSVSGIYHYCGNQSCSWYDFANAIFREAKAIGFNIPIRIHSISAKEYPSKAFRPAYSALDCSKIKSTFGVVPSNWKLGIKLALIKLHNHI